MQTIKIDPSWYIKPSGIPTSQSAGGIVIRFNKDKPYIALVKEHTDKYYVLPKGHLEQGENIEDAARREIKEETGLSDVFLISKLDVLNRLSFKKSEWKEIHYFLFTTEQFVGIPTDKNKSYSNTQWFPLDNLPDMLWPEQEKLIKENIDKIMKLV